MTFTPQPLIGLLFHGAVKTNDFLIGFCINSSVNPFLSLDGYFAPLANRMKLGIVSGSQSIQCTIIRARVRLRLFESFLLFDV